MNNNLRLKYYSSGSYGVMIKDLSNNFIYKITEFSDLVYINVNNFNEMIYLNYFKNKYPNLYKETNNNLPIQNVSTHIYTFGYFIKLYGIDEDLINKIIDKLEIKLDDLVIVNKMKFYPYTLDELKKKDLRMNNLYLGIEKIILGLHFFHSNGLAHGDLKSLNIVSNGDDDFKIIDFGGIKYITNPKYDCTCTCTYRSPEDYDYEYRRIGNKNILYTECPLKSDIWSLGLVFNELVNKSNPVQTKYNQFRNHEFLKNNIVKQADIEYKIYLYLRKIKNIELISNTSSLYFSPNNNNKNNNNNNNNDDELCAYRINKIIEQMLNLNPKSRINLDDIYLNLFYQELPNLDKNKIIFNYNIKSNEYYDKFINFRKKYYLIIKLNLENRGEVFLYPFISNLLDRLIIDAINKYLFEQINFEIKFNFIIELLNFDNNLNNGNYNYNLIIFNMNICYFAIYIISKLVILRKNTNTINNIFNSELDDGKKISVNNIYVIYEFIISILNVLNYDIIRTKLFFYSTTPKELVNKFITIIDDFNIKEIIKYIE